jgi:hypothetical protein
VEDTGGTQVKLWAKELQVIPEIDGTRNSEMKVVGGGFIQLIQQRHD